MPMVRPPGPPEPRNHARVVRTESLKSERSDKRVSFNKDVGVKHIPRGQKQQQQQVKNNLVRPPPEDEWAHCAQVHREPVKLSSRELEQQAEDLVKLLDHVNCDTAPNSFAHNTRSLDRPKNKNNKNFAHHHYNNVIVNNVRNNTNNKNINVLNGEPRGRPRTLPTSRTANPINRRIKGDVNRAAHPHSPQPLPNGGPLAHRHRSADHLPDSDLDSPPLVRRSHPLAGHKSVPDLNTVYYDNNEAQAYKYQHLVERDQDPVIGYKSVDTLYDRDDHGSKLNRVGQNAGYKSVDNLTEHNQVSGGRLQGFKSVGHLPSTTYSDSDDMSRPQPYKPKVGNIIKKFNAEADGTRRTNIMVETEMDVSPRGTLEPDRFRNHNNNQPFSYTGTQSVATVQTVRRLSPTRDLPPRATPPRDSPPRDHPVYAQVNKKDGRIHTNGTRDAERNYRNTRQEREYSAKIIITDDDHRPYQDHYDDHYRDSNPKNHYQEDDDAYESYQVPEDNIKRLLHEDIMPGRILSSEDLLDEYKEQSNNNINMSSVGVQTDALPKAPSRSRKTHKSSSPSPTRQHQSLQKQYQHKQQQMKHEQKQHHQNLQYEREAEHYMSQKHHHQRGDSIHNNLTSATLVRQVNHGFGRTDRSPSPPLRRPQTRQPRKNVVPLLSDTSDSEAEHRRRTIDPLARIRDQVMQREKLQEEEEEEEEARNGRMGVKESIVPYRPDEMTPLTIDEVDALSLVMEDTGKKSLVVSNQSQSTSVMRTSNHRSHRSETVTERMHSQPHKDSLPRPQKPPRDKNHAIREATPPTRGHREQTPTRIHREATPTRGHREATPTRGHREATPTRGHRETTPTRTHREATPTRGHREATPTRGHREATPTRGHGTASRPRDQRKDPPTMERNKKNNLEKERATKASKQKDEKKEKKKKRIKIKFFYDPRPQDEPDVDPLANFTEFRGSSSEERTSPHEDRRERADERTQRDEYHRSEHKEIREDSRHRRGLPDVLEDTTSSRDRRGSREQLSKSREQLSRSREQLSRSRERLDRSRERLDRSREHLDSTPRQIRHSSRDVRETKTREVSVDSHNGYGTKRRDSKDSKDSRDNRNREAARSRSRDDLAAYDESPDERRNDYDNQHPDGDYNDDNDERGSPDGRPGRSLSDKYRSGPLYDPPAPDEAPPAELIPHTEDDEKQEKIMRQRKKFFSVLMSDGRNKNAKVKTNEAAAAKPLKPSKKPPAPQPTAPPSTNGSPEKAKSQTPAKRKPAKKKRAWPWALLGLRGGGRGASRAAPGPGSSRIGSSRVSSRASSRASSRSSHRPRRPSVRASKIRREGQPLWFSREREEEERAPPPQWESSTLNRAELRAKKDARQGDNSGFSTVQRPNASRKYSAESSASSEAPPARVARTTSFKQRYFGDTDIESSHGIGGGPGVPDYRSLPNRSSRSAHRNVGKNKRPTSGPRGVSPGVTGSAGSSLQSSESEVDSHGGSHASRASKASRVSTGSNRSVYLHATAVADIPVRRASEEVPSERGVNRQSKKVSRSFSLLAPWKPRHYREKYEVEYDNREAREARAEVNNGKGALPPRPPRRPANDSPDNKKVNRSQSMYKDSRLAGWLRRRRNKEAKGI